MDATRVSSIYDDLLKLHIELNFKDTPTPAYIQEKLIKCNEFQIKNERFFIETTRDLANADKMFRTEKLNLEMLRRHTLTNNEKIKRMPTGKEREAAVDEILEENHRNILKLENEVDELTSLLSAIKQNQTMLKNVNADIKTLVRIMEQQINYLNVGHPDDPDVKELAKTFSDIDKLEEEIELDGVESSVEIPQAEDSEGEITEGDSDITVELDVPGESVASTESSDTDESMALDDGPDPEPIPMATQREVGQSAKDVEESSTSKTNTSGDESDQETIPTATQGEDSQGVDEFESELASILTEDEYDPTITAESDREGSEEALPEGSETPIQVGTEEPSVDISIDDSETSDVKKPVSAPPVVEVDLKDVGIDIDLEEGTVSTPAKVNPPTNEPKSTNVKSAKSGAVKKEDPPIKKPPDRANKADTDELDLNDILSSLDE